MNTAGTIPSAEDIKRVKGLGFLRDKNTKDCFNGRVITRNGKITAAESRAIAEAAERFGNGEIAMTTRLTVEIQHVPYDNIEPMRAFLKEYGLETGGTGSKVRPVVSCKGTTCQYGLIDTYALSPRDTRASFSIGWHDVAPAAQVQDRGRRLPEQLRQARPERPWRHRPARTQPTIWTSAAAARSARLKRPARSAPAKLGDGKLDFNSEACNHCGRCVRRSVRSAWSAPRCQGYAVYIGGRWGKRTAMGRKLDRIFTDKDEVLAVIERALTLFRDQGRQGERFSDTIARLGFETVQQQLLAD